MLALFGVSFLTPFDALFALAAVVPLAALALTERRSGRIRKLLALPAGRSRALVPTVAALVLLPALVGVAAAQPVVVHEQLVSERADAQAFLVLDTSLSMQAASGPAQPTRLARAKQLALRLRAALPDLPTGIASMTDRVLPNLMPTTDAALFARTLGQSVGIDRPPPSQSYSGRATSFMALVPLLQAHFFASAAVRRLIVVFTDGEAAPIPTVLRLTLQRTAALLFVHVWRPDELIWDRKGGRRPDPGYRADPTSTAALESMAQITGGQVFDETQLSQLAAAARNAVGFASTRTHIDSYARIALAPWFALGGILPLGFLLYRRNL